MPQSNLPVPHASEARTTEPLDTGQLFHNADMQQLMLDAHFKSGQAYFSACWDYLSAAPFCGGNTHENPCILEQIPLCGLVGKKARCLHSNGCKCYQHNKRAWLKKTTVYCLTVSTLSNSENPNLYLENNITNPPKDMNLQRSVPPLQSDSLFSVKNQKKVAQV